MARKGVEIIRLRILTGSFGQGLGFGVRAFPGLGFRVNLPVVEIDFKFQESYVEHPESWLLLLF